MLTSKSGILKYGFEEPSAMQKLAIMPALKGIELPTRSDAKQRLA